MGHALLAAVFLAMALSPEGPHTSPFAIQFLNAGLFGTSLFFALLALGAGK